MAAVDPGARRHRAVRAAAADCRRLIALPCLIVVGALASRQSRLDFKSAAALIGVVAFCVLVFVKGLGVPMPLLGSWLVG
jgi:hypothetical protein